MPAIDELRIVDPALTEVSMQLAQNTDEFWADDLFPMYPVKGETGSYHVYDAGMLFRVYDTTRADGATARMGDFKITKDTYFAQEYAFKDKVTDREKDNALNPIDLGIDATRHITEVLRLGREVRARDNIDLNTGITAATLVTTANWDQNASDVFGVVFTAQNNILLATGKRVNWMGVSPNVFTTFRNGTPTGTAGAAIAEKLKYSTPMTGKNLNEALFAQMFDVETFKVGRAIAETDPVGITASVGKLVSPEFIWGNNTTAVGGTETKKGRAMLASLGGSLGVRSNVLGMTFAPTLYKMKRYRVEMEAAEHIEGNQICVEKVVNPALLSVNFVLFAP